MQECLRGIGLDAPLGELERRHEEPLPREAPASFVRLDEPRDEPGDGDGGLADVEDLRRRVGEVDLDLVHLARRRRRDREEAVERDGLLVRFVEEEEAAAGRAGQRAFGHERSEGGGEGGVDRRAPFPERPGAGLGRVPVARCDRAAHGESVERLEGPTPDDRSPVRLRPSRRNNDQLVAVSIHGRLAAQAHSPAVVRTLKGVVARAERSGLRLTSSFLRRRHLVLAVLSTATLAVLVASPSLLGERVGEAVGGLGEARPAWLWTAAGCFVAMHVFTAIAWSTALRTCGTPTDHGDAVARYGVGSALNATAPAHLGSAVRLVLFARVVGREGAIWTVGGASAAVGAIRSFWFSLLVAGAAIGGVVPVWPLALLGFGLLVAGVAVVVSPRLRLRAKLAHVLDAFAALGRSPRAVTRIGVLTLASLSVKVAGATAVASSFGIDRPLLAALVIVPAVELAAAMPITPGNAGGLERRGRRRARDARGACNETRSQ